MSVNLILWDKDNQFSLYQTPTALTQRVLASDRAKPSQVRFPTIKFFLIVRSEE